MAQKKINQRVCFALKAFSTFGNLKNKRYFYTKENQFNISHSNEPKSQGWLFGSLYSIDKNLILKKR